MWHKNKKITYTGIFSAAVFVLLLSRILVLTGNYDWFIDPVSLEIVYLFFTFFVVVVRNKGKVAVCTGKYLLVLGILLVHTILWGFVFVDDKMSEVVSTHFKSQIMFVVILCVTVWAILQLQAEQHFFKCGYYVLALVMFVQLIINFSEIDLSNLGNIFTAKERTRANFGFGHYNALGSACVCVIVMQEFLKKQGRTTAQKVIDFIVLLMAVVMLLCSASRSAITGLIVYLIIYYGSRINHWHLAPVAIKTIKVLGVFAVGFLAVWVLFGFDADAFLVAAQRALLFTHTLPMFFKSGKVMLGLGYASNTAYAIGETPYITYWMDNAYIYYLVATGVVGLVLLLIAFLVIGRGLYKIRKTQSGVVVFAAFVVYAYMSLFEATLFNSGSCLNYIYLPWFVLSFPKANKGAILNGQGKKSV